MRLQKIFRFSLVFLIFLFLCIASLPTLLSTTSGKKWLLSRFNTEERKIEIETLRLNWLGPQKITHLRVTSIDSTFSAAEFFSKDSLFSWIVRGRLLKAHFSLQSLTHLNDFELSKGNLFLASSESGIFDLNIQNRHREASNELTLEGKTSKEGIGTLIGSIEFFQDKPLYHVHLKTEKLPTAGIDEILALLSKPPLSPWIGQEIDLSLDSDCCLENSNFALRVNTPLLQIDIEAEKEEERFTLIRPGNWTWTLLPSTLPKLHEPLIVTGQITELTLKQDARPFEALTATCIMGIPPFQWNALNFSSNVFSLSKEEEGPLLIDVDSKCVGEEGEALLISQMTLDSAFETLKGTGKINFSGKWQELFGEEVILEGKSEIPSRSFEMIAKSPLMTLDLEGKISSEALILTKGSSCTYLLKPLNPLLKPSPYPLIHDASLDFTVDSVFLPFYTDQYQGKGQLSIPLLTTLDFVVNPFLSTFEIDPKKRTAFLEFQGEIKEEGKKGGSLEGCFQLSGLNWHEVKNSTLSMSLNINALRSNLLTPFIPKTSLDTVIGPVLDLSLLLKRTPHEETLVLKGNSREIQFELPLSLKENIEILKGHQKAFLHWTLTKEAYSLLSDLSGKAPRYELSGPGTLNLELTSLSLPSKVLKNQFLVNLSELSFKMQGTLDEVTFTEKTTREKIGVSQGSLFLIKEKGMKPLEFRLEAKPFSKEVGALSVKGHFDHFSDAEGRLTLEDLNSNFQATASRFPTSLFNALTNNEGIAVLFGPKIDVVCTGTLKEFSGPIKLDLESSTTNVALSGTFIQGTLHLNAPIKGSVLLTPALSTYLLKDNSLALAGISAEKPLTFFIDNKGFSLPLNPYSLSEMKIGLMSLDLGKIKCKNQNTTSLLLSLLKVSSNAQKEIPFWFAPFLFHLDQGILTCERTEILFAHDYDLCTWGKINLLKDKMEMTLGVTKDALQRAFGITNLPEEYVLQIPMKGKVGELEINTSKAATQIAALIARDQLKSKKGSALGEVLGFFGQHGSETSKVPSPKHPFPWEDH